ncbi:MAG: PHP domain-containing protein [Collinsella sp.]
MILWPRPGGYVNLMQTVSEAAVQGFYYKPRVTLDNLRRHAKGMICTSACIAGIIPKYIDRGDMEGAIKWAETFRDTFDPGDFYIEIQEHGITTDNGLTDEQMDRTLIDIAKQVGVKVIATNDFHYLRREEDARAGRHHVHRHERQGRRPQPHAHDRLGVLHEDRGGDAGDVPVLPRGLRQHARDRRQVLR